jgi:hypothetical protein
MNRLLIPFGALALLAALAALSPGAAGARSRQVNLTRSSAVAQLRAPTLAAAVHTGELHLMLQSAAGRATTRAAVRPGAYRYAGRGTTHRAGLGTRSGSSGTTYRSATYSSTGAAGAYTGATYALNRSVQYGTGYAAGTRWTAAGRSGHSCTGRHTTTG